MAWPSEAGSIACAVGARKRRGRRPPALSFWDEAVQAQFIPPPWSARATSNYAAVSAFGPRRRRRGRTFVNRAALVTKYYFDLRGLFRIFNAPLYRVYCSEGGPPAVEGDTPKETTPTLPYTLTDPIYTVPDTHYWSLSRFNGVMDSGFGPVGANGETFQRFDLTGQADFDLAPPQGPRSVRLELRPGGVVRIVADYGEQGALRASQWAVTYTTNGTTPGTPPAVAPTVTVAMNSTRTAILVYDLPAQANGVVVKVRLQTRRSDDAGVSWRYSEGSTVLTATADAVGPTTPLGGDVWRGRMPE